MSAAKGRPGIRAWFRAVGTRPRPHPRVTISLGPTIPAWSLRLVIAAIATWCAVLVISQPLHWAVAVPTILMMATGGAGSAASIFVVGTGVAVLTSEAPTTFRLLLLVFGVHLAVELTALLGDVHWAALVERRILWRSTPRFLLIQTAAQSMALFGAWTTVTGPLTQAFPVLAGAMLACGAWMVLANLRR